MTNTIENKVVVITGGAQSIGLETAISFLENGAGRVIILDINEDTGKETASSLNKRFGEKVDFYKCDVTKDLEEVSKLIFDKFKVVDVLVNNAGIANESDVRKTIEINVIALIEWSNKFSEHMSTEKGGKGGTILNVASIYGFRTSDPFVPVYKASKHAIMGFTKTLGHEYYFKRFGVRVVAICPGYTTTNLGKTDGKITLLSGKTLEDYLEYIYSPAVIWQTADAVGKAAVEVFKVADSGTAWLIEGGKPAERVP
ncbi:short chain dehydrogenase domain-containing protein [Phthorimaea operculella]|nr:short chain dehydrogenase domain-containing protein [Phthorimaea operculella]